MAKAYAILCLRQNEINDLQKSTKQNPMSSHLMGVFIPFWQGGLYLRLVAGYFLVSSHLQT